MTNKIYYELFRKLCELSLCASLGSIITNDGIGRLALCCETYIKYMTFSFCQVYLFIIPIMIDNIMIINV